MTSSLPRFIERFFTQRLMRQRNVSMHTVASYRDTFKLFLRFAHRKTGKPPSSLVLEDFDAELVIAFLDDLTEERRAGTTTYNLRLTAIRAFFRFLAFEEPAFSHQIQRVLAIPGKIGAKGEVQFLVRDEIKALLAAPDKRSWVGRRDYCLLLTAIQTGMRLSEPVGLDRGAVTLDAGAHIRCFGKGRKERVTPLTKILRAVLKQWLDEPRPGHSDILFPTVHGSRMSPDAVQYLLAKHVKQAAQQCPSLRAKRISPHVLRHSAAMELLDAGVDSTVISLWLGHESTRSTQAYLHAHLAIKEAALAKVDPLNEQPFRRFKADDKLLSFLDAL
ncbi:tyrosine-type recombinase/integrase [Rhizobium leguminosarum]|uniref:tyrosine-type recombinase/integrase n=1 Tax=Rhizobium leguminosarum TaxID=384 RepID=UPI00103DF2CD|nr:tyrosine-type recombinase/integrase [Rhizobium leguminosarum]TCA59881.1 integrase [Rhizobium leguminosarum bv. viciae]TCB24629.1 integrase [Rhizobium leguminosarum bv. viciae]